jgi:hypothetical protein
MIVSEYRGQLNFSGSHLLDALSHRGLQTPDTLTLLQDLIALHPSNYPPPTISDMEQIAVRVHGYPVVGQLVATILEDCPVNEVAEKLHEREEIRQFVLNRLLGRISLSSIELQFLTLASILRIPVTIAAFTPVAGSQTRSIVQDLVNRFLLFQEGDRRQLHELVAEHFRSQLSNSEEVARFHKCAHNYYESLRRSHHITSDEKLELIYHGIRCGGPIQLEDFQLFAGPIRTAMFEALRERSWNVVDASATRLLDLHPTDSVARVAKAIALGEMGRPNDAEQYVDSVVHLERDHLWVGVEFARSRIRRRDYEGAARILEEREQQFGQRPPVLLARAQLLERQGFVEEAISRCQAVLDEPACAERDAFGAGLILRNANRLEPVIAFVEMRKHAEPLGAAPPVRLCVRRDRARTV